MTGSDLDTGTVTNRATASGAFGTSTVTSNTASETADVAPGSIVGVVFDDLNMNEVQDHGEGGLGNVTIRIYDQTGTTLEATVTTAPNGSYSVSDLRWGDYLVEEQDLPGYVSTTPNVVAVAFPPGETATANFGDVQVRGNSTNEISGIVYYDANSDGVFNDGDVTLTGVQVTLYDQNGHTVGTATTGTGGRYSFNSLGPGLYTVVEANPAAYPLNTTLDRVSVVLTSGTDAVVNFGDQESTGAAFSDPAVTKYGSPSTARVGDTVIFTITVGNNGTTDAPNVGLSDTVPSFLDIISVNVQPDRGFVITVTGNTFTIPFGTVTPTDSYTVTVVTRVNSSAMPPGGENTATITPTLASATALVTIPANSMLPPTGFAPGRVTVLPLGARAGNSPKSAMMIEIPALGLDTEVVGVPEAGNSWDISWLGNDVGYLEGTAFPTWNGNSILTGHVYGASGLPGPFVNLKSLKWSDAVIIDFDGQRYIYQVRTSRVVPPDDTSAFGHESYPWLTLVTCQDYDPLTNTYAHRVIVGAVLVKIESDSDSGSSDMGSPAP